MGPLTPKQLQELNAIIEKHVGVLLHVLTGTGTPDKTLLKKLGIPTSDPSLIENSFVLGKVIQMLEEGDVQKLTFDELKERAKSMTLSQMEKNSLQYAQINSAQYVTSLGQRMTSRVNTKAISANKISNMKAFQRQQIKDKISQSILDQETRSKLASELYHEMEDWTRDWRRVAHTELWNARLQGEVASILEGDTIHGAAKGGETKVFRRPSPDACTHCKRLYLESDGVTPKVFSLDDLISNGDNVGRKTAQWLPTTHVTHPNCTCPIAVLPDGFGFDKNGNLEFMG